ncbi:ATP-binding cassette domain-containing protein, partial [Streptomyces sp. B1866]|uniref:ATP-binding cassette domain-containing protein n=1 Tax=Streptomyces sp. B1866 TaxID=3075431 RepID=UPI0028909DD1
MIQAIGLTSVHRPDGLPAVDAVTFEAPQGRVTALFGAPGAGKTTALRLLLQFDRGHGAARFRDRPLCRIRNPAQEIGVLLEDLPVHPGRTARGQLRMLGAAVGVPAGRADDVLDVVGLADFADQRLGGLPTGVTRRLGIAAALLGDPHTLVLDDPARCLAERERAWLTALLRGFAAQGGAVLVTGGDAEWIAEVADQVLTLEAGRLVAEQPAGEFGRAQRRRRVAVRSPFAGRLAALLEQEGRERGRPVADRTEPAPGGPAAEGG